MRTTPPLDDAVGAKLPRDARASGRSFADIVNRLLRIGLNAREGPAVKPFSVGAAAMRVRTNPIA